jgi:hypothetical protein
MALQVYVTVAAGTAVTSALLAIFVAPIRQAPRGWLVTLIVGIAGLWLVMVKLFGPKLLEVAQLRRSPPVASIGAKEVGADTVEFYPQRRRTTEYGQDLAEASRVSVLWNTGAILLYGGGVLPARFTAIKRLLLPHPDRKKNPAFVPLVEAADDEGDLVDRIKGIADKIREVTRAAQKSDVEVKWWPGLTGNGLTIADEWILVEQFMPFLKPDHRPSYRIEKSKHPDLYYRLCDAYDRMWHDSEPPPPRKATAQLY